MRVRNLIQQRRLLRTKFSAGVVLKPGEVAVTSLDDAFLKRVMDTVEKRMGEESFGVKRSPTRWPLAGGISTGSWRASPTSLRPNSSGTCVFSGPGSCL